MSETALVRREEMRELEPLSHERDRLMPVFTIGEAVQRFNLVVEFVRTVMVEGKDYGVIEGTGDKNTLLKPGAEKLCTLFGLTPRFEIVREVEDWSGEQHGGEPFFYYLYKCQLYRGDFLAAEGDGSCNSREKKYRWRQAQRVCPECKQPTIFRNSKSGSFFCSAKNGGCGKGFKADDQRISSQPLGRVPNPDIADQVNTIQKMSQKRALIAATLIAVNASEYFTQDLEDIEEVEFKQPAAKPVRSEDKEASGKQKPEEINLTNLRFALD
ncbi:MAG: hypothetical protein AB1631_33790, partial [Acidobacteriota bacterium]